MKKEKLSDRICHYVFTRNDEDLSVIKVEGIATTFDVNPSYLSRRFKDDKSMTLNDLITYEKMRRSANMLAKDKNLSIVSLCERTGFSRSDYFVILFKHFFGVHPKKFREMRKSRIHLNY